MIITKKEVIELAELGVDMRVYVDLKTFYHSFTPALLIAKLGLDVDFNRVYKKSLDKLINDNNIVLIKALGNYRADKYTINTPLEASFTYIKVEKEEGADNYYCIFDPGNEEYMALREANLTAFEMAVYLAIAIHRKSDTFIAFPSQDTLAEYLKSCQESISRGISGLKDKDVLEIYSVEWGRDPVKKTPIRRNKYYFPKAIKWKEETKKNDEILKEKLEWVKE